MASGNHTITVDARDEQGNLYQSSVTVTVSGTVTTNPVMGSAPQFGHVYLLVEENHEYSDVVGGTDMPYLNTLIQHYGLATNFYAESHPSIGNYFMLTAGQLVTNNDSYSKTVDVDNIVRQLVANNKTWKAYA